MEEQHLVPFFNDTDSNRDDDDNSIDDSSLEVTSTIDENECELIRLSTYLNLDSTIDDEGDDDQASKWPETPPSSSNSSDIEQFDDSQQGSSSTLASNNDNTQEKCIKRKRRQWNIKEKLDAVALFDKNKSKRKTALMKGCTSAQLRNWIKNKEHLIKMYKQKKG